MSRPDAPATFDPDEDLFAFDGVAEAFEPEEGDELPVSRSPELAQAFAALDDTEVVEPEQEGLERRAAAPPTPARPAPAPRAPSARPATTVTPVEAVALAAAEHHAPPRRVSRSTTAIVAIGLAVTLLNTGLAVVVVRGRGAPSAPVHAPEPTVETKEGAQHTPSLPEPEDLAALHSHPTLDQAREELESGDYARARRRLYELLAVIDRFDEPRRGALESDCEFLLARSLHLEALARVGEPR
jgi:hypothetical protein